MAQLTRFPTHVEGTVARWQWRLGLVDWYANREAISPLQVMGEDGAPGHELVGVVIEWPVFTIVHTRELTEHDIIHELLHVAFPLWDHEEVERWTDILSQDHGASPVEPALPAAASPLSQEENLGNQHQH